MADSTSGRGQAFGLRSLAALLISEQRSHLADADSPVEDDCYRTRWVALGQLRGFPDATDWARYRTTPEAVIMAW